MLVLCGSNKGEQGHAIERVIEYLNDWKRKGRPMHAPRDKSYDDSLTVALTDPDEAAAYIESVMELEDPAALLVALRQAVKAQHGIAEVARRAAGSRRSCSAP